MADPAGLARKPQAAANVRAMTLGALRDPWWRPDDAHLKTVMDELFREVPRREHALSCRDLTVVARCAACDEVLVRLDNASHALVHVSWTGQREQSPWPRTVLTGGDVDTQIAVERHAAEHE